MLEDFKEKIKSEIESQTNLVVSFVSVLDEDITFALSLGETLIYVSFKKEHFLKGIYTDQMIKGYANMIINRFKQEIYYDLDRRLYKKGN